MVTCTCCGKAITPEAYASMKRRLESWEALASVASASMDTLAGLDEILRIDEIRKLVKAYEAQPPAPALEEPTRG